MTASPTGISKSLRSSQNEIINLDQSNSSVGGKSLASVQIRKTRSASVDEVIPSPRRRSTRRTSAEEKSEDSIETTRRKTRTRAASVSQLPAIKEEGKGAKPRSRANSAIESYATARRLTRRQASMIKGMETPSSVTARDDSDVEKAVDVDAIDPIKLLDKETFQGPPDPEEADVYDPSSPSNSTASSFSKPAKRVVRSASAASESSAPPTTPRKKTRRSLGVMDAPSPTGMRTRSSSKHSETSSVASEKSDPPTPPKRSRKQSTSKDSTDASSAVSAPASTRNTRSRTNSVSSAKSDTLFMVLDLLSSPKKNPRNRRLVSAKSQLPEIVEEKGSEVGGSSETTVKRPTRKKKVQ
ncbi:hypothetical protein NQ315_015695 [Exocentrus adspersus]|uniref:Uncharacterized protein n=1 Tax=Exocentrus adspersus TaxID=1586481 RepID=A0AAV8W407_9CUCU|nr:hypothetical protein NQ315_015695 [Exocentrus adspersus]